MIPDPFGGPFGGLQRAEMLRAAAAETERLASVRGSISGDAWLQRGTGDSYVLRGLRVYVCSASVPRRETDVIAESLVKACRAATDRSPELAKPYFRISGEIGTTATERFLKLAIALTMVSESISAKYQSKAATESSDAIDVFKLVRATNSLVSMVDRSDRFMREIVTTGGNVPADYKLSEYVPKDVKSDELWPRVVAHLKVAQGETGIDGKYQIRDVKGGKYYLYAVYETNTSIAEWMIPVDIKQTGDITISLHNGTAAIIANE